MIKLRLEEAAASLKIACLSALIFALDVALAIIERLHAVTIGSSAADSAAAGADPLALRRRH